MPNVTDMGEGLKITRQDGKLVATYILFIEDMPAAASTWELLAYALTLTAGGNAHTGLDVPSDASSVSITIDTGKPPITLYANGFDVVPWGVADAQVTVTYTTKKRGNFDVVGFGPTIKEVGSTAEEEDTDFDWANLNLPFNSRHRIQIKYDETSAGAPGAGCGGPTSGVGVRCADARVKRFAGKPLLRFTREQTIDPEDYAENFVAFVNLNDWRGYAAGTVLCVSIIGRNPGNTGIWTVDYQFAVSKYGWKQYARWIVPETGQPPQLTTAQIAGRNGIDEITVQGAIDFAPLSIPL